MKNVLKWLSPQKKEPIKRSMCKYLDVDTGAVLKEFGHSYSFVPAVSDYTTINFTLYQVVRRNLNYDEMTLYIYVSQI